MLSLGGTETPDALFQKFAGQQGVQTGAAQRTTVNGLAAVTSEFQAQDQQGTQLAGRVLYLRYGATTYQLLGYSTAQRYGQYASVIGQSLGSFAQLTDAAALARQPNHLVLVRLPRAMTIEEFHRTYPSPVSLAVITAINGVSAGATLPAGFTAKRVR
jgi:predicted Zn-dependent protease